MDASQGTANYKRHVNFSDAVFACCAFLRCSTADPLPLLRRRSLPLRPGRTAAAFEQRLETITAQLEQASGTITEIDGITVRQSVNNIKVVSKDTLLICFKNGTEITQAIGE